jgi:hypothetical protein
MGTTERLRQFWSEGNGERERGTVREIYQIGLFFLGRCAAPANDIAKDVLFCLRGCAIKLLLWLNVAGHL